MRVLQVTPSFTPETGGLEKVVSQLAQGLASVGVKSGIAHVRPLLRPGLETLGDVDVWRIPQIGHRLAGVAPGLRRVVQHYDVIHVHDPQVMALSLNASVFSAGKVVVLSTHGGYWHTQRLRWLKRAHERSTLPWLLSHYDRVLATSGADLAHFSRFCRNIVLAENGVETVRFASIPDKGRSMNRWIYWGRLSPNKRLDTTLELARAARDAGIEIDFLITGPDSDGLGPDLLRRIEAAGLSGWVRLAPPLTDAELDQELATRGLYVTATEHEGFGLGVVEAMAAGLIVACRDVPPINGFVAAGKTGQFFDFDGGERDTARLVSLLSLDTLRQRAMSTAARTAAQTYGWGDATAKFLDLYAELSVAKGLAV